LVGFSAYIEIMAALSVASLRDGEQVLLDRFVEELRLRLGGELRGVWLFGSRAREERPAEPDPDEQKG